jgi:hypothetical protein
LVKEAVNRCKHQGKRFVIFPYSLTVYYLDKYGEIVKGNHRNFYVYDLVLKSLERFEPHGVSRCLKFSDIDDKVEEAIEKTLGSRFVEIYYRPSDYCPDLKKYGFQAYEGESEEVEYTDKNEPDKDKRDPGGFCQSWAMWYADLRLSNPDINRKVLIDVALVYLKDRSNFRRFIRNYSAFGFEIAEKKSSNKWE